MKKASWVMVVGAVLGVAAYLALPASAPAAVADAVGGRNWRICLLGLVCLLDVRTRGPGMGLIDVFC